MKKEKIKGPQATNQLFDEAVKEGWKKRTSFPVYPLKEGDYRWVEVGIEDSKPKTIEDETGSRLLEEPIDPLTDYKKKLVLYFTGGKGLADVSYLKAFLVQSCGVANPEGYTWRDIISALEIHRESKEITPQAIMEGEARPETITLKRSGDFGKQKTRNKHTQKTANIAVKELLPRLKEQMDLKEITVKFLSKKIDCSTGLISQCPAWTAFVEKRDGKQKSSSKTERLNDIHLDNTAAETKTPDEIAAEEEIQRLAKEQKLDMNNQDGPNRAYPDR